MTRCRAAVRDEGLKVDDGGLPGRLLIIGAGPIGLATLEFAKLTGAKIIVLDMGKVVAPIKAGEHAHVHNIKTKRW